MLRQKRIGKRTIKDFNAFVSSFEETKKEFRKAFPEIYDKKLD